jgi:HSP20 family protein
MWSVFNSDAMKLFDAFERQFQDTLAVRRTDTALSFLDNGDELVISADVPGMKQSDIDITIEGEFVTLRAERKPSLFEGFKLSRSERGAFKLVRQIELPCRVDADAVRAELKDGVLTVHLPKAEGAKPRRIPVTASA